LLFEHSVDVAIIAKNSDDYIAQYLACSKIGVICTPLNWRLTAFEFQYILEDSDSVVLLAEEEFFPLIESIKNKLPKMKHYFLFCDISQQFKDNNRSKYYHIWFYLCLDYLLGKNLMLLLKIVQQKIQMYM